MRILMLGNSFIYYHDMFDMLAEITGAEVKAHTRGGAFLKDHLDPADELGKMTAEALKNEKWDYVVLQDQSCAPAIGRDVFLKAAEELCRIVRANGAIPVFYATWPYKAGNGWYEENSMSRDELYSALRESYHRATDMNGALIADVGKAFYEAEDDDLYDDDGKHPSEMGSRLAAACIAGAIAAFEGK